jgi:mannose-6-phosphate isomerase-like protein (cupin superfamily)
MAMEEAFTGNIRKVVMGHDATGRTIVASDAPATTHGPIGGSGMTVYDIWETFEAPTPIPPLEPDPSDRPLDFRMPDIGIRFRIAEMPPGGDREPFMHRTESIETVMVLRGEMTMLIDDGTEVVLRAGDTLIQRATNHAWVNRGPENCRILFLMIGGKMTQELKDLLGVDKLEWDPVAGGTGHSEG